MASIRNLSLSVLAVALSASAFGQIYSNRSSDVRVPALNAQATSQSGVAAPAGGFWSEVQNDTGNLLESNTSAGFTIVVSGATGAFRLTDDYVVAGGTATINTVRVFGYQTTLPATTQWATSVSLKIWNGRPSDVGSTVVVDYPTVAFTENTSFVVQAAGTNTVAGNLFRCFNTVAPAPGTAPGTTRVVRAITCTLPTPLTLNPGTYWVDYQVNTTAGTLGGFNPSTTHAGFRAPQNPATVGNAQQFTTTPAWVDAIDTGNPATAPDLNQDLPFMLSGQLSRWPNAMNIGAGLQFGGNMASLNSDDSDRLVILCDENDPNSQVDLVFNTTMPFNGISYVGPLSVAIQSSSSRTDQIEHVSIFNVNTNALQEVTSHSVTLADSNHIVTASNGTQFVSTAGNVGVRIVVFPNGDIDSGDGWTNSYDMVNVRCGS